MGGWGGGGLLCRHARREGWNLQDRNSNEPPSQAALEALLSCEGSEVKGQGVCFFFSFYVDVSYLVVGAANKVPQ